MTQSTDFKYVFPSVLSSPDSLSDTELLATYAELTYLIDQNQRFRGHFEMEIRQRMEGRGGTAIPSDAYTCELKPQVTYNQPAFTPLKEIFLEGDLKACLTPAHPETVQVADKWNTVKVKALVRRYGAEAERIVEAAKVQGPGRLHFEKKE